MLKHVEFMRKGIPKEAKVKDIRNLFNSRKEADTPALLASVTDVLKSELIMVENEIKKIDPSKKKPNHQCLRKDQREVGTYALIHGTKAALELFNKTYPKYTFLRASINNWKFDSSKDKE